MPSNVTITPSILGTNGLNSADVPLSNKQTKASARNIGVIFDSSLSMSDHTSSVFLSDRWF